MNRLWSIKPNGDIETDIADIEKSVEPEEYALAYNPQTKVLHFGSATPEALTFTVQVYDANGRKVGTFRADNTFSMASLPSGIYIASWSVNGHTRSAKFRQ